jgi:uncharacterized protein (TIGR03435 family)
MSFKPMVIVLLLSVAFAAINNQATGQSRETSQLQFEVATLKQNRESTGPFGGGCRGIDSSSGGRGAPIPIGRCLLRRVPFKMILQTALNLRFLPEQLDQMIVNGPSWTNTDMFDIDAKSPDSPAATEDQLRSMLLSLIKDQFQFEFHRERRELPGLALVTDKSGAKLKPTTGGDPLVTMAQGNGPLQIAQDFKNVSMDDLVRVLSARMGRAVVNKTQLTGHYDFSLRAAFDAPDVGRAPGIALPPPPPPPGGSPATPPAAASEPAPSIYTAIQEQLGLRLESQRVPVEVIVIDRVERPSGDRRKSR